MKAGWKVRQIEDVAFIQEGPGIRTYEYQEDGFPMINVRCVQDGFLDMSNARAANMELALGKWRHFQVEEGDILFTTSGTIGRCAIAQACDLPLLMNTSVVRFRPTEPTLDARFLYLFLQSEKFQAPLKALSSGTAIRNVGPTHIKTLSISLPPLEEQHQIVAVLDAVFEGLARTRAHAEANLRDARELFDNVLSNAFSRAGWPVSFLHEISENLDRVRVPITKGDRVAGSIPYYGASGVVDQVEGYLFDEDLLLVSEDGANLLARSYPIAFSISGKSWVNNHAHVLRFPDFETQEFVRRYLNSISLEPYVSGMAQPKLNQAQLNRIPIPFPSAAERAKLVAMAQMISAETVDLEQRYRASIADLDALRQSLLQKAFAGELT